jgi:hypothetical protein
MDNWLMNGWVYFKFLFPVATAVSFFNGLQRVDFLLRCQNLKCIQTSDSAVQRKTIYLSYP